MADGDGDKATDTPSTGADGLEPIGQALRATYDAENHDTLGGDLTGLMLALARIDDPAPPPASAIPAATHVVPRSWRRRLFGR